MSTLSCFHSGNDCRGRSSQMAKLVSVTQHSEGPFSIIGAHLLEDQKNLDFCCRCCFFNGTETKKKQSPCCFYDSETPAEDNSMYNLLLYAWLESRCMRKLLV